MGQLLVLRPVLIALLIIEITVLITVICNRKNWKQSECFTVEH